MIISRTLLCAALMAGALALPGAVRAEEPDQKPGEMLQDGMRSIMGALELLLMSIPQYAAPEVLPNGDILIRRVNPAAPPESPDGERRTAPDGSTEIRT